MALKLDASERSKIDLFSFLLDFRLYFASAETCFIPRNLIKI